MLGAIPELDLQIGRCDARRPLSKGRESAGPVQLERGSSLLHRENQQRHGALPPRGVKTDVLQLFASDRTWGNFGLSDQLWVGIVAHR